MKNLKNLIFFLLLSALFISCDKGGNKGGVEETAAPRHDTLVVTEDTMLIDTIKEPFDTGDRRSDGLFR